MVVNIELRIWRNNVLIYRPFCSLALSEFDWPNFQCQSRRASIDCFARAMWHTKPGCANISTNKQEDRQTRENTAIPLDVQSPATHSLDVNLISLLARHLHRDNIKLTVKKHLTCVTMCRIQYTTYVQNI